LLAMRKQLTIKKLTISLFLAGIVTVLVVIPFWDKGKLLTGSLEGMTSTRTFHNISLYSVSEQYIEVSPSLLPLLPYLQPVFVFLFLLVAVRLVWMVRKGLALEEGMAQTFLWFLLLVSIFYQWYVLPAIALLALQPSKRTVFLVAFLTAFGLLDYFLSVLLWFDLRLFPLEIHVVRALFLTIPLTLFLLWRLRFNALKSS
ncbi:MAG: hypothetical protein ACRD4B_01000, partial [Acidobacteriota bacterium]